MIKKRGYTKNRTLTIQCAIFGMYEIKIKDPFMTGSIA